jgi:hypothetical protein
MFTGLIGDRKWSELPASLPIRTRYAFINRKREEWLESFKNDPGL